MRAPRWKGRFFTRIDGTHSLRPTVTATAVRGASSRPQRHNLSWKSHHHHRRRYHHQVEADDVQPRQKPCRSLPPGCARRHANRARETLLRRRRSGAGEPWRGWRRGSTSGLFFPVPLGTTDFARHCVGTRTHARTSARKGPLAFSVAFLTQPWKRDANR